MLVLLLIYTCALGVNAEIKVFYLLMVYNWLWLLIQTMAVFRHFAFFDNEMALLIFFHLWMCCPTFVVQRELLCAAVA